MNLERHVTADMFVAIDNPFESHPDDGWRFAVQCVGWEHEISYQPPTPNSERVYTHPDLVERFRKRLSQKFEARWSGVSTIYHGIGLNHETV